MASFFLFAQNFTIWLIIPAILGLIATIIGNPYMNRTHRDWGDGGKLIQPFMAIAMPIWGTALCICWRRILMGRAYFWQNGWLQLGEEFSAQGISGDMNCTRPEFAASFRQELDSTHSWKREHLFKAIEHVLKVDQKGDPEDPVLKGRRRMFTERALRNDVEHFDAACYIPPWVRLLRQVTSLLITVAMAGLCFLSTLVNVSLAEALKDVKLPFGLNAFMPAAAVSIVAITILDLVHCVVAEKTTDWQAFRDDTEHEGSLFQKIFIFNLFNNFNSLFYIALYNRNMEQLRTQVMFLSLSMTFKGNLVEMLIPAFLKITARVTFRITQFLSRAKEDKAVLDTAFVSDSAASAALSQVKDHLSRQTQFLMVYEEIEMVMLHGMVIMFSLPFPLTPLVALLGMLQELRIDSYKLLVLQSWPEPRMQIGVGRTFQAFLFVTCMSLWFNGALLYMTEYSCGNGSKYNPVDGCFNATGLICAGDRCDHPRLGPTATDIIMSNWDDGKQLQVIFVVEHVLLGLMFWLLGTSPVSAQLRQEQYRQSYYENRVELTHMQATESMGTKKLLERRVKKAAAEDKCD